MRLYLKLFVAALFMTLFLCQEGVASAFVADKKDPVAEKTTAEKKDTDSEKAAADKKEAAKKAREERKKAKNKKAGRLPEQPSGAKTYRVVGGRLVDVSKMDDDWRKMSDSLQGRDSLHMADSLPVRDSLHIADSVAVQADSLAMKPLVSDTVGMSKRELKRWQRDNDTSFHRHSAIFRDTMSISKMGFLSVVVPGFSQLYNKQYWKIPILYATVGASLYFGIKENREYSNYKRQYEALQKVNAPQDQKTPVEQRMIRHNTSRQLLFAAAAASYIYFIGDGALNYPNYASHVKKATTLSTICPGAGQIYNRSYWKVPIVVGGFATLGYMIDFNARGYKRFKLAYDLATDGDDNTKDEFDGRYSADFLRNTRNNYRRNRDLCIIVTCAWYLLNIIDAHVDAYLKDYDVSDDLSMSVEPAMMNLYTMRKSSTNGFGLSLKFNF